MVDINLLPPHFKKKTNILAYLGDYVPYLVLGLIIILCINLILGFFIATRIVTLKSQESRWKSQEPQFKEISSLKQGIAKFRKEYDTLTQLAIPRLYFSKIMYLLYDNLRINIWFREFNYNDEVLKINGGVLDFEKDASISLKEYVDSLRKSQAKERFPEINIASQDQVRIKDKIVLYFQLELKGEKK